MISFQLRICPRLAPTQDYHVTAPTLPRIGEVVTTPAGVFQVTSVDYEYERLDTDHAPNVLVVARLPR